jgi:hypothetical protein
MSRFRPSKITLLIVAGLIVGGLLNMFERFDRPVRCRDDHLFTTIWIPLASLKAIRLGNRRFQHCPVGHHWAMVTPLDRRSAGPVDLEAAAASHDIRIP